VVSGEISIFLSHQFPVMTLAMATAIKLTVEDYKVLPETGPRYQLIEGDLYMSPAPSHFHQQVTANLRYPLTP